MSEQTTQSVQPAVSQEQLDVLDQLLKPEVQASLTTLVDQLPKLTEMMTTLTKAYDVAQTLATDDVFRNDAVGAVTEMAQPVVTSAKSFAANAIEAKDRAAESQETIGLFGMLKLLKDPQVQGIFRFANAFLEVSKENKASK
ncbi:hypothetical protein KZO01_11610 [Kurthia zopfii]|uniref:Uncharacterized conserved protein n=1 Tax=Kurthia zopfii TaxID=1650 RepID=A0A2U3AHD8_9BACL|nr:DUF1641 domain-containing protein [Kurthia zopfii]PWI23945.1 hypothetical protein DF281_00170 [Kurthia zopfii]TDR44197.1 uncharacterized protein YjgD (DUF1641 family) [Kurthia zopfii]STX10197.1 Uncharacterized conserved protein [Kurthia zopfii]VEI08035.1 Uncharacterized conserved protein [Kurthia zopfii]GEK30852.1 hypothetical protein KZO01_11610 [Kurthia zopfii]